MTVSCFSEYKDRERKNLNIEISAMWTADHNFV